MEDFTMKNIKKIIILSLSIIGITSPLLGMNYPKRNYANASLYSKALPALSADGFSAAQLIAAKKASLESHKNTVSKNTIPSCVTKQKLTAPAGLQNGTDGLSNRCFINATIQCTYALKDISNVLLHQPNKYEANSLAAHYIKLIQALATNSCTIHNPVEFSTRAWNAMNAQVSTQHDSAELLQILMNNLISPQPAWINNELKELCTTTTSIGFIGMPLETAQETILPIHITPEAKTLEQCMRSFFDIELIDHNNDTYAQITQLEKTSKYAIINLKRNMYNSDQKNYTKNESIVSFPITDLNITPYAQKNMPQYELVGCIMHSGNSEGGHYTAYTKHGTAWYFCDDACVKEIDINDMKAIAQRGYGNDIHHVPILFFYQTQ